jgi:hypothetical protein
VPTYLVESYVSAAPAALEDARERARRTAELGIGVRYLRTTFLPGDETILHLFEAPSVSELDEAGQRAALQFERIVEAVEGAAEVQPAGDTSSMGADGSASASSAPT